MYKQLFILDAEQHYTHIVPKQVTQSKHRRKPGGPRDLAEARSIGRTQALLVDCSSYLFTHIYDLLLSVSSSLPFFAYPAVLPVPPVSFHFPFPSLRTPANFSPVAIMTRFG